MTNRDHKQPKNQHTRPGRSSCEGRYRFINTKGQPLVSAASLRGLPVHNNDGENLGFLKELMIETNRGTVSYAVLQFENDKSFALPFTALEIDPQALTIYVDIQREVFEAGQGLPDVAPNNNGPPS